MAGGDYHIFVKDGDATAEVTSTLAALGDGPAERHGFHKMLFVTRASQTVVFLGSPDSPLSVALRSRPGWREPGGAPA